MPYTALKQDAKYPLLLKATFSSISEMLRLVSRSIWAGSFEAEVFDHFGRREGGEGLGFAVEAGAAHADFFADHVYIEIRIWEVGFDDGGVLPEEVFVLPGGFDAEFVQV